MSGRISYVNERRILEAEFKDIDNNPVNVADGVVVYIEKPNGFVEGPFSTTRTEKGVYRYDYYPEDFGKYEYRFQNPNGNIISEKTFNVKKSVFEELPPFGPVSAMAGVATLTYTVNALKEGVFGETGVATITHSIPVAEVGGLVGISNVATVTYTPNSPEGVLKVQFGDAVYFQEGSEIDGTLDAKSIGHQKRISYPNGSFDPDDINLIYDYSSEPWTPHYIRIDSKNFKIVFAAQNNTNDEEWYIYTINFDGSGLTKIYDAPIDTTPGREFSINGLYINNRDNAPTNERLWVSLDGTYGLIWRGFLISMAIDGTNQVTQSPNLRNASELLGSDRDNLLVWDVDDAGFNNYTMDPLTYLCDSGASTKPTNSRSGGLNGVDNKIYNRDAFGTIRVADSACFNQPYTTFVASHPGTANYLVFSDYSSELVASGRPAKAYDKDTPGSGRIIGKNSIQTTDVQLNYVTIYEPEFAT